MVSLHINQEQCILCGQCVEKCPFGALEIKDNKLELNASCKMCKLCIKNCPVDAITLVEEVKETVDKDAWKGIMVFMEQEETGIHPVGFELIGEAKKLSAKLEAQTSKAGEAADGHISSIKYPIYAVLIGGESATEQAKEILNYGVEKVYVYAHKELKNFRGDVYTNVMEDCINNVKPSIVLVGATSLGRSLAPSCATRFRTGLTADCTVLEIKENTDLVQIRPAFGGNIMAQILTTNTRPQFATVRYKVMDVAEKTAPTGEIISCQVTEDMLVSGMEVLATEIIEKNKGIEEEDVLVVAGRGVKKQEDMAILQELAQVLGGQLATTRPLVEKGWNDVTKQIGLSGRTVKPKLIITCGVSGSVQFAAGMDGSECIVAINTDKDAPIFKIASYCIVDDLYTVVPALIAAVKEKKNR